MGRLMDSVMAALGLKPSDRVNITAETPAPSDTHQQQEATKPLTPELEKMVAEIEKELPNRRLGGLPLTFPAKPVASKDKSADEKQPKDNKAPVEELLEVPVAAAKEKEAEVLAAAQEEKKKNPEDCFSCKVTGVSSGLGLSGLCLYMAKRNPQKLTGLKLTSYRTGNIMLAALTGVMAMCIAFDMNLASEEELKAQEKRSIAEQFDFEMNYIKEKLVHQQVPGNSSKNTSTEKS